MGSQLQMETLVKQQIACLVLQRTFFQRFQRRTISSTSQSLSPSSSIQFTIERAAHLRLGNLFPDSYVTFSCGGTTFSTKTVQGSSFPIWQSSNYIAPESFEEPIVLNVWHQKSSYQSRFHDPLIGKATVHIKIQNIYRSRFEDWFPIFDAQGQEKGKLKVFPSLLLCPDGVDAIRFLFWCPDGMAM